MAPVTRQDSDGRRKTNAIHHFQRQLYLTRWNLQSKAEKNFIYHCDKHEMVREKFNIEWNDSNKTKQMTTTYLICPAPAESRNITRHQRSIRTTIIPTTKVYQSKRKNNDDDDSIINDAPITCSKRSRQLCCFKNCKNRRDDPGLSWKRIPTAAKHIQPTQTLRSSELQRRAFKQHLRNESLRRIGLIPTDDQKEHRICNQHEMEKTTVSVM